MSNSRDYVRSSPGYDDGPPRTPGGDGERRKTAREEAVTITNASQLLRAYFLRHDLPEQYTSRYRPSTASDPDARYHTFPGLRQKVAENVSTLGRTFDEVHRALGDRGNQRRLMDAWELGNFRATPGRDDRGRYISFYDRYDWDALPVGRPVEIYDRIYEDEYAPGTPRRGANRRPAADGPRR